MRTEERFFQKVEKTDACWLWLGRKNERGYGFFDLREGGRTRGRLAHRVAWAMAYGPIPTGKVIRHACDNPACVRVDHLRIGTQADNIADMDERGRRGKIDVAGSANGRAKLTKQQVAEIRSAHASGGVTFVALAAQYGVAPSTVSRIVKGLRW